MNHTIAKTKSAFDIFHLALEVFIKSENLEDLCREIVHSELLENLPRGAYVYTINSRSKLVEAAGYGERYLDDGEQVSAWDDNPISKSARGKRQIFAKNIPEQNKPAVVCLPFLQGNIPVGVFAITLNSAVDQPPFSDQVVPAIAKLGAFFLETRGVTAKTSTSTNGRETPDELTSRQVIILGYLGDGLTNAEISTRVLLSESTVRQETIRIYRSLAVGGRLEAVSKARALGIIPGLANHGLNNGE